MSKESKRYEITTVWPQPNQNLKFLRKHCKSVKDMKDLREECSSFLKGITFEDLHEPVVNKISWLLKWQALNTAPKEHQWQLVNSDIPAKHIKQKLYTFEQLLKLNAKQANNLFSPTVQEAMTEFKFDLTSAVNLTYLQKQIWQSDNVQKKISAGKLTLQKALKLTRKEFQEINTQARTARAINRFK